MNKISTNKNLTSEVKLAYSYTKLVLDFDETVEAIAEKKRAIKRAQDEIISAQKIIKSFQARLLQANSSLPKLRRELYEAELFVKDNREIVEEARPLIASIQRLEKKKQQSARNLEILKEWNALE